MTWTITLSDTNAHSLLSLLIASDVAADRTSPAYEFTSLRFTADSTNTHTISVGDSLISSTNYAYLLSEGDQIYYAPKTVGGSRYYSSAIWLLAGAEGQILHVEGMF